MRIEIVEQGSLGLQPESDCQSAAKRFDEAPISVLAPERFNVRDQPALAARPLQRRSWQLRFDFALRRIDRGSCFLSRHEAHDNSDAMTRSKSGHSRQEAAQALQEKSKSVAMVLVPEERLELS